MVQTILRVNSSRDKGETKMARTKTSLVASLSLVLIVFARSPLYAQVDVGNFTVSGEGEIGGMPRNKNGDTAKFEEYRDIPESVIVPQLQLMIGSKKEDFYFNFDSNKTGRNDQFYHVRFGRYGLLDVEFTWDQIPHLFNVDTARTPYIMNNGNYTLATKPASAITPGGTEVRDWVNRDAQSVDLKLFNGIARFNVRYTPAPGWTFTGGYWSNNNAGTRSFGTLFGTSPGTFNITELAEPISYNTHNIELGTEYAGQGWSIGLKYNGSLFYNNVSTLTWDNPVNLSGTGAGGVVTGPCIDQPTYTVTGTTLTSPGPCRGRLDLYPSNQAHTFTLSGAATLPFKSHFMGTASYGWRVQDDSFLPVTSNRCYTSNSALVGTLSPNNCAVPLLLMPRVSRGSLNGDVRPLLVNATLVNNFFDRTTLKAYYRFYDLQNRSNQINLPDGWIINDSGTQPATQSDVFSYSKNDVGLEGGYDFTRWLSAKFGYNWQRMHRTSNREITNSDEHILGPTVDIKPNPSILLRASYKHSWRDAPGYQAEGDPINILRKFDEAKRNRDKSSLFAQYSPWEQVTFHAGFEFTADRYPDTVLGTQNDFNYSPSIGLVYAPAEWIKFFTDYNWDRYDWRLDARATVATPATTWFSRGRDQVNTVTLGSDVEIIRDLLNLRLQYGFSDGVSKVSASGNAGGTPPATNYPSIINRWHEFLVRLEYKFHKNVGLNLGYYYNGYHSKDYGVDIMQPWMGDFVDPGTSAGTLASLRRSIFLGDQLKGSYMANVGFLGLRFKF
jgi:MtrB/PioB family decaheme-associated outer membrane protein